MEIEYQDTIRIVETTKDGYGSEVYVDDYDVPAVFEQNTGWRHQNNQDALNANATAFVDPTNDFVQSAFNRLEGMLVIADPFSSGVTGSWYRITSVTVSRASQLDNEIDNIQLLLKKTSGLTGIS